MHKLYFSELGVPSSRLPVRDYLVFIRGTDFREINRVTSFSQESITGEEESIIGISFASETIPLKSFRISVLLILDRSSLLYSGVFRLSEGLNQSFTLGGDYLDNPPLVLIQSYRRASTSIEHDLRFSTPDKGVFRGDLGFHPGNSEEVILRVVQLRISECPRGYLQFNETCLGVRECGAGYYLQQDEFGRSLCLRCPEECVTCESSERCKECRVVGGVRDSSCRCSSGYFLRNSLNC